MTNKLLIFGLALMAALQGIMLLRYEVHWDEFLNLSMLYDHRRGDLTELLQTGFVHLIAWVPAVSDNEVGQVIAARALMTVFALSTSWGIYAVTRALVSAEGGVFAVLAYWSFSYVFTHGIELRTDAMSIGLIMPALWLAITRAEHVKYMLLAGALTGLAGALTIKAIFFVPTLALVAVIRAGSVQGLRRAVAAILCAALGAIATFLAAIALHGLTFDGYASPFAFLNRTMTATLGGEGTSAVLKHAIQAVSTNVLQCLLALIGLCLAIVWSIRGTGQIGMYSVALVLPLFVPLVYRDVYPYFYTMLLAPVAPLCALTYAFLLGRSQRAGALLVMGLLVLSAANLARDWAQTNAVQRMVLDVVDDLFDADAPYIDGRSMVAARPKVGLFMSLWGMGDYRRAGVPIFAEAIAKARPEFLLMTNWQLDLENVQPEDQETSVYGLLAEDARALRAAFVPFWGPIFVPGARFDGGTQTVSLHLDGHYRNMAEGAVIINQQRVLPGGSVYLVAGSYALWAERPGQLRLDLPMPANAPPQSRLFSGS